MSGDTVIKVEGLYKKFCRNLRRSMYYGSIDIFRNMVGLPAKSSEIRKDEFWALQDINFELKKGEILGIIGINGSGKSTLLRVLSGIFPPDRGRVVLRGDVGSLIAVGAGFHPHMTGRENIFLNGAILGMSRQEIRDKYQSIIDFAEIGDFLEAPVATYSSGMKVRLGFSIAIHRVPEILLIDEVLAVGDVSFKKKCMNKMSEITERSSIIFISHNMYQIERICNRVVLLDKGIILNEGEPDEIISQYYDLTNKIQMRESALQILDSTGDIYNLDARLSNGNGEYKDDFDIMEDILFEFTFESKAEFKNPVLGIGIANNEGILVTSFKNVYEREGKIQKIKKGKNYFGIKMKQARLLPQIYRLQFKWKREDNTTLIEARGLNFKINSNSELTKIDGFVKLDDEWIS